MVFKSDLILVYKIGITPPRHDIVIVNYMQYRIKSATNLISCCIYRFLISYMLASVLYAHYV